MAPRLSTPVLGLVAGLALCLLAPTLAMAEPTVFAAASMKTALDDVAAAWKAETGKTASISYAASSALARQIEAGAPADMFISADREWMDFLGDRQLVDPATRVDLLGNAIVLIAPKDTATEVAIAKGFPLASLLGDGRLAIANVDSVPAGKYGKAALENLGLWDSVKDRLAQAENVRAALVLVSRGETPLGIVYQTDAAADPGVRVVGTFPPASHPPIIYPVALTAGARDADAGAFLAFLQAATAKAVFEKQGFTVLAAAAK